MLVTLLPVRSPRPVIVADTDSCCTGADGKYWYIFTDFYVDSIRNNYF
jgi:hypothetical protein